MPPAVLPSNSMSLAQVFGDPHLHVDGEMLALAFAPDGTLWSVEEPGVLRHWDAVGGRQLDWQALSDLETQWCFSNDARVLASASNDLTFWDTSSGHVLTAVPQPSWVDALAFHPDPAFLATGHDDGAVRIWDAAGHHLSRELRWHKRAISALAFSPDGNILAAAAEDKTIALWQVKDGVHLGTLTGHTDRIPALAWHPSSKFLVSAGWDTMARVWDVATRQPAILLNTHTGQVTALAFSSDGSMLASADSANTVHLWDFNQKKELHVLKNSPAEIRCLAFSPDGNRLASSGDHIIHLWNPRTGQPLVGSGPRTLAPMSLALSPEGSRLVCNGGGLNVKLWNTSSRQPVLELLEVEVVHGLAYSPDGKWVAGAAGKHVQLWQASTGRPHLALEGSGEPFTCVAFAPDSVTLASASSTGLGVWWWRVADGEPLLLIPDALDGCTVEGLAFHPNGRLLAVGGIDWLATGGSDGAVCLWDLAERCEVATFLGGATAIAFHPAGKLLASTTLEHSVCIWDVESQEIVDEFTGADGALSCIAFSPDGTMLATGGEDRVLRIWDSQGHERAALELDSQVLGLAFSPDGRHVYTANANTTCYQCEVRL